MARFRIPHFSTLVQWAFAAFLTVVGLDLSMQGALLVSLGGSGWYALTGLALIAVATLTVLRHENAPRLFGLLTTAGGPAIAGGLTLPPPLPPLAAFVVVSLWSAMPWTRAWFAKAAQGKRL